MTLVIGALIFVGLFTSLFRLGLGIDRRAGNPALRRLETELDPNRLDLTRLTRDMAAACRDTAPDGAATAESPAEQRELDLCRQLLDGTMPATSYRQLMSQLAHDPARSDGVR